MEEGASVENRLFSHEEVGNILSVVLARDTYQKVAKQALPENCSLENLEEYAQEKGLDPREVSEVAKQLFPRAEDVFSLLVDGNCDIKIEASTLSRYITNKILQDLVLNFPGIYFQVYHSDSCFYIYSTLQKRIIRKRFLLKPKEVIRTVRSKAMIINKYTHILFVNDAMFIILIKNTLEKLTTKFPKAFSTFTIHCTFELD